MKKLITFFTFFFVTLAAFSQAAQNDMMAVDLRSSGKIYVVVAVIALIFIGIAVYLFNIDRRIRKIEKGE